MNNQEWDALTPEEVLAMYENDFNVIVCSENASDEIFYICPACDKEIKAKNLWNTYDYKYYKVYFCSSKCLVSHSREK